MKKLIMAILLVLFAAIPAFGAVSDYAGVYSGLLKGDDYGIWNAVVDPDGHTKMAFYSTPYRAMDGATGYYIDSSGNVSGQTLINKTQAQVKFSLSGEATGSWTAPNGASGTLSGMKQSNNSQYAGAYSGNLSGAVYDTWSMTVNSSGVVSGSMHSAAYGSAAFQGAVNNVGVVLAGSNDGGSYGAFSGNDIDGNLYGDDGRYFGRFSGTRNNNYDRIKEFVSRFYVEVLDRQGESDGLTQWSNSLQSTERAGSDVANGFIFSQEFINKAVSNDEYLNILYSAFFNRAADQGGYSMWIEKLNGGSERKEVLDGFLNSQEFSNLCSDYGIMPVK